MRIFIAFLTFFALAAGINAQAPAPAPTLPDRFHDTSPSVLAPGEPLTVRFTHTGMKGQSVTVEAREVGGAGVETITIPLDGTGKGSATFNPPTGWEGVDLRHSSSQDHVVPIDG